MDEKSWAILQSLSRDMSEVRAEITGINRQVAEMRDDRIRELARAEAMSEQDAEVRTLPRRVSELERNTSKGSLLQDEEIRSWAARIAVLLCGTAVTVAGIMAGIVSSLPTGALSVFSS